jgi:arsenical pump membrane protein
MSRLRWLLAVVGVAAATAAALIRPGDARLAAAQDWSPFVLVAGLLLIGLVADGDGLFGYAGARLGRVEGHRALVFAGAVVIITAVTVTLNLDTAVAFLTPVLVYTARGRAVGAEAALLYACLMLANAGSLLLPGSNLTNLIVLGHLHLTGGQFIARMWLPWLVAVAATAAVVAWCERGSLRAWSAAGAAGADSANGANGANGANETGGTATAGGRAATGRPVLGVGLAAVLVATVLVLALSSPAIEVAAVGVAAAAIRLAQRRASPARVREVLGLPVLIGLFGVAVALGALGRAWSGPAVALSHLGGWATAALAALAAVVLNNLPAASLLASRAPVHPFWLLVGLNLGPNLAVTGSLAWLLWLRAARMAGAHPSIARASRIGLIAVPLSMALALAALTLTGSS